MIFLALDAGMRIFAPTPKCGLSGRVVPVTIPAGYEQLAKRARSRCLRLPYFRPLGHGNIVELWMKIIPREGRHGLAPTAKWHIVVTPIISLAGYSFNCLAVFQQLWELIRVGRTVHGTVEGKCRIPFLDRFNGLFVVGSAWIFYNQGSPFSSVLTASLYWSAFEGSRRSPKLTYSPDTILVLSFTLKRASNRNRKEAKVVTLTGNAVDTIGAATCNADSCPALRRRLHASVYVYISVSVSVYVKKYPSLVNYAGLSPCLRVRIRIRVRVRIRIRIRIRKKQSLHVAIGP